MTGPLQSALAAATVLLSLPTARSFVPNSARTATTTSIAMAGKGFGSSDGGEATEKTYGKSARNPIRDLIDDEAAMSEFFGANEDWSALFRSLATSASVPAMSFIGGGDDAGGESGTPVEFTDSDPWTKLDAIPTAENELPYIAAFLDSVQQSLVDIPVTDSKEPDELDMHFIEEGRRMLVLSRFHVLPDVKAGCIDSHRELFATCWSELLELRRADEPDTGSLIILPGHDIADLRRFVDMNLQRPLDWLGMGDMFEVASLQRESPAIRLLHRLGDIPDVPDDDEETTDEADE